MWFGVVWVRDMGVRCMFAPFWFCNKSQHFNIQPGFYEAEIQFGHFKYLLLSEAKIKWNEGGERILSKICQSYERDFCIFHVKLLVEFDDTFHNTTEIN